MGFFVKAQILHNEFFISKANLTYLRVWFLQKHKFTISKTLKDMKTKLKVL